MNLDYYKQPEAFYNVMWLSQDPRQCAEYHCDMHIGKGLLWAAKILSQVWFNYSLPVRSDIEKILSLDWSLNSEQVPYGMGAWRNAQLCGQRIYCEGHNGHPLVVWAGLSGGNYITLYQLACALSDEHVFRFNEWHASLPIVRVLELLPPQLLASAHVKNSAPIILPEVISDYKEYYRRLSNVVCKYTRRGRPVWLK